jgi:predicted HAD superfamily Cof-like phosphohydrolase
MALLREFHEAFGIEVADPTLPAVPANLHYLRANLHREEFAELEEALAEGDMVHIAQELADLAYVVYGIAVSLGINLDSAIREVHRANMSKLGDDLKPIVRDDGKVLKGPNYQPPNMTLALTPAPPEL